MKVFFLPIWLNQENLPTHVVNLIQIPTCLQLLEFSVIDLGIFHQ